MDHNSISTNRPRDNGEGASTSASFSSFSSFSANGVDIAHAGQGDAAAASCQAFGDSVDTPDYAYAYSDVLEGSSGNIYVERDDPTFAERVDQEDDTDDDTTDEDTDYGLDDVDGTSVAMSDEEECRE
ncbi:hypothetical protein BC939DRAFT_524467 [Gamsiella multidivaricata]|uniref:uncharacterized protein n=1 Tax=Gamsiella multidivaricata TaxID=101098 RepID=UPI0022208F68|nr:uncharacterized protein BC939DRAFT_524467 [Gamsiella multidivaricata]KAI7832863.1 hypothetical protein BC939DRAFT_524467 [Gamsiella multidivaricata]